MAICNDDDALWRINYNAATDRALLAEQMLRPSMILRPRLSIDGDQWCALYGDNLQDGVAGFGTSPGAAYQSFDMAWHALLTARKEKP